MKQNNCCFVPAPVAQFHRFGCLGGLHHNDATIAAFICRQQDIRRVLGNLPPWEKQHMHQSTIPHITTVTLTL